MDISELQDAIENSPDGRVRIEAGTPGTEDYDTGYAFLSEGDYSVSGIIDVGNIVIGWDSGVQTVAVPGDTFEVVTP